MKNLALLLLATSACLSACSGDDDATDNGNSAGRGGTSIGEAGSSAGESGSAMAEGGSATTSTGEGGAAQAGAAASQTFTVTLENVAEVKPFTSAGVFNTPLGDASPGPITPGKKYEFTIDAGRKQKLSFATMLAATNDLFFAPNGDGIALYDDNGEPINADVTDQIQLWDAGTEINEEPKVGANTVSKQAAPNTGPDEHGNVVSIADATDGVAFDYPSVADVLTVSVAHLTGTQFKVTITNVSSESALHTSEGDFAAPMSPGVWVVHNGKDPLFSAGLPDRGQGIERIAEDGNPTELGAFVAAGSGITYPASPGAWVVHSAGSMPLFTEGEPDYGDGVEHIAEDGNPSALGASLGALDGQLGGGIFNIPVGKDAPGPILPGSKYQFSFEASPGDALSFATMLAATNDVFFGPKDVGIPLFDADDQPLTGDITDQIYLWDAGTEGNEEPGIGPHTVTNQLAPDTGTAGEDSVELLGNVNDGYTYPNVASVLKVTVSVE
jgi:hypothetical protein